MSLKMFLLDKYPFKLVLLIFYKSSCHLNLWLVLSKCSINVCYMTRFQNSCSTSRNFCSTSRNSLYFWPNNESLTMVCHRTPHKHSVNASGWQTFSKRRPFCISPKLWHLGPCKTHTHTVGGIKMQNDSGQWPRLGLVPMSCPFWFCA